MNAIIISLNEISLFYYELCKFVTFTFTFKKNIEDKKIEFISLSCFEVFGIVSFIE